MTQLDDHDLRMAIRVLISRGFMYTGEIVSELLYTRGRDRINVNIAGKIAKDELSKWKNSNVQR